MILDQFYTYFDAENLTLEFEEVLKICGITIEKDSILEYLCLNILDVKEKYLNPNLRNAKEDIRIVFREFLGLQDLMTKIVRAKKNKYIHTLIPHLKLLNISSPLQNAPTSILNQVNNKTFELYMATLCLNLNEGEISVDHPNQSKGDNPDVIALISGKKWGFACKVLHSLHPQTIFDNIEKAVEQIEGSDCLVGVPLVNIKNIIDHDLFWPSKEGSGSDPEFGTFLDIEGPLSMIVTFTQELHRRLVLSIGPTILRDLFLGKKSYPCCLVFSSTATSIMKNHLPTPTRLNVFNLLAFNELISEDLMVVTQKLNHQLQLV